MVDKVEGCIVLMVASIVLGATSMLLVTTFTTMESTSIMVLVPSSTPPILIVPDLVLDDILTRKGATKRGKKKSGKAWA
jgi:hypothetical protein